LPASAATPNRQKQSYLAGQHAAVTIHATAKPALTIGATFGTPRVRYVCELVCDEWNLKVQDDRVDRQRFRGRHFDQPERSTPFSCSFEPIVIVVPSADNTVNRSEGKPRTIRMIASHEDVACHAAGAPPDNRQ
jgi:hypothetical protein